jgi:predicted acyl esterase
MSRTFTLLVAVAMLTMGLAGCVGTDPLEEQSVDEVEQAAEETYNTSQGWSTPTEPARYDILDGFEVKVDSFDDAQISVGVFLPDKEACDWGDGELPSDEAELAEACQVPVVIDAGPYWADAADEKSFRPPLVEWLVPRGYAVLHMSVRGTGESDGCMEFMSEAEQKDVDEVVTWAGEAAWSNGNVGMMGRSYDGTTPLMAAAQGNPHLETVVPISGVASAPDLMFKNGTSESRGPIMHSVVYWTLFGMGATYGADAADFRAEHWSEQACEELVVGQAQGAYATATGDTGDEYWQQREFRERILENYNGSVWIVHGLQDWNVNPSQVVPWVDQLMDSDIQTKAWLGQWNHHYPDRVDEHRNARWDWADQTLDWFDHYLKDEGDEPDLNVEVEDSLYNWRTEATYPPEDREQASLEVDWGTAVVSGETSVANTFEPLEDDLRIAGMPQVRTTATPSTTTGGWVFAELYDVWPDGTTERVGWGTLDLRHHEGGNEDPAPLVPGQPVEATIQFEPMDAHVAEGHQLQLVVHKSGVEDIPASPDPSPVALEDTSLRLPTIERPSTMDRGPPQVTEPTAGALP